MNTADIKRLGLILAVQAEIEGMKSENTLRERQGCSLAYDETDFCQKAEEIRDIVHKHDDRL